MGVHMNLGADRFPRQGGLLHRRVNVCFNYGQGGDFSGTCIRDDQDSPGVTIFHLDDGRVVLATECQYSIMAPFRPQSTSHEVLPRTSLNVPMPKVNPPKETAMKPQLEAS